MRHHENDSERSQLSREIRVGQPRWSGGLSPEFVEHDLLLRDAQFRLRNGFPRGIDVGACPALGDEHGESSACNITRDLWEAFKCALGVPAECG